MELGRGLIVGVFLLLLLVVELVGPSVFLRTARRTKVGGGGLLGLELVLRCCRGRPSLLRTVASCCFLELGVNGVD